MNKNKYIVSIVIPVFDNWELSRECLQSLHAHTHDVSFQVVMVDNGSTDATPDEAPLLGCALFGKHFIYLRQSENLGFAKACNLGAWASNSKYVFFLNNDTTVTADWLEPLLEAMRKDSRLAGVGPLLLFPDGNLRAQRVQHLGMAVLHGPEFRHLYELFPALHPVVKKQRKLCSITAAAFLVPSMLFKAMDGFFEGFVNGYEDTDFCCRISRGRGYFSVIPESVVYHHTNRTAGRFEHESDNRRLFLSRCRNMEEDFYQLIAEDGYEPGFTSWLEPVARLPKERARALEEAFCQDPTLEHLNLLIDAEPLWDGGYVELIRMALAVGDGEAATTAAYLRSLLCPSLSAFHDYADLMKKYGNRDLTTKTVAMISDIEKVLADSQSLIQKMQAIEKATDDPTAITALKAWKGQSGAVEPS